MYKTIFLKHTGDGFLKGKNSGYNIQMGNLGDLENTINNEYNNGWELVSVVPAPYPNEANRCNYVLIFKKRNN